MPPTLFQIQLPFSQTEYQLAYLLPQLKYMRTPLPQIELWWNPPLPLI